jgi:hypothetical protein
MFLRKTCVGFQEKNLNDFNYQSEGSGGGEKDEWPQWEGNQLLRSPRVTLQQLSQAATGAEPREPGAAYHTRGSLPTAGTRGKQGMKRIIGNQGNNIKGNLKITGTRSIQGITGTRGNLPTTDSWTLGIGAIKERGITKEPRQPGAKTRE